MLAKGDEWVTGYTADQERREFRASETAVELNKRGLNAGAMYDADAEIPIDEGEEVGNSNMDIGEVGLINGFSHDNPEPNNPAWQFYHAAKTLHDSEYRIGSYEDKEYSEKYRYKGAEIGYADLARKRTPQQITQWGIDKVGMTLYSDSGAATAFLTEHAPEVARAYQNLLEIYEKQLPNGTAAGIGRMAIGTALSPSSWITLASAGWLRNLLMFSGKDAMKLALKNRLGRLAKGSVVIGAEAAAVGGSHDLMQQHIEAGGDPFDIDFLRTGTSAAIGFALGAGVPAALGVTPSVAKAAAGAMRGMTRSPEGPAIEQAVELATARLTTGDRVMVGNLAGGNKANEKIASDTIRNLRARFSAREGWDKFEVVGGDFVTKDGKTTFQPKFKLPAYDFHKPKGRMKAATHLTNMTKRMVDDVSDLANRANKGDKAAQEILAQATWYREVATQLRREFGGLGDVFADILGATSARTQVRQNVDNALAVLKRHSRGEFDKEMAAYTDRLAAGDTMGSPELHRLFAEGKFPLITKATGELFNMNSPKAAEALLGIFRDVKVGQAPKTLNFMKNILDIGDEATIDMWAARYLRDLAGLPRIIPGAEKSVGGKHLTGSTFEDSKVGGEFKFGQDVFAGAAEQINQSGLVKKFDPSLGDLDPKDLQAVAWFMEKKKWADLGQPDIGGSMAGELNLAGTPNQARVTELRKIIGSIGSTAREKKVAEKELKSIAEPLQRTVLGVTPARDTPPTNVMMAQAASDLEPSIHAQDAVTGYQLNNSIGRYVDDGVDVTERAINGEIVARADFDPAPVMDSLKAFAKKYDQDAVFMARVVPSKTPDAKPGTEIYFKRPMPKKFIDDVIAELRKLDVDGFTVATDARHPERVDVQARLAPSSTTDTAGQTGVRWIYIPDYDDNFPRIASSYTQQKYLEGIEDKYQDILHEILKKYPDDIANGNVLLFDIKSIKKPEGGWK